MLNFTSRTTYYLSSTPTDMRNGREGLAGIIREKCSMILIVMMKPSSSIPRITARLKYYITISMVLSYTRSGLMTVSFSSLVSWRQLAVIR